MKKIFFGVLVSIMCAPLAVSAYDFENVVRSWSDTGGNVVGSGGSITTGASHASVRAVTVIDGSVGTSTVDVTTSVNGQTHHETITKPVVPGVVTVIDVGTSTGGNIHITPPKITPTSVRSSGAAVEVSVYATSTSATTSIVQTPFNFASAQSRFSIKALFRSLFSVFGFNF